MKKKAIVIIAVALIYIMTVGVGTSPAELTVPCCMPSDCNIMLVTPYIENWCFIPPIFYNCSYTQTFFVCKRTNCTDCFDDDLSYPCRLFCEHTPRIITAPCDPEYSVHIVYYRASVVPNCPVDLCFCDCASWEVPEGGETLAPCPPGD